MSQRATLFGLVLVLGLVAGCGQLQTILPSSAAGGEEQAVLTPEPGSAPENPAAPSPPEAGRGQGPPGGAWQEVNQLALGTLYLQTTEYAITSDQAAILLPLWQGVQDAMPSTTSAQADISEWLSQIEAAMTPEQNEALANMGQDELLAWAQEQGLMPAQGKGQGPAPAQGEGQGQFGDATPPGAEGDRPNPPPEERGTPWAEGEGFRGFGLPIIDDVISLLESLVTSP